MKRIRKFDRPSKRTASSPKVRPLKPFPSFDVAGAERIIRATRLATKALDSVEGLTPKERQQVLFSLTSFAMLEGMLFPTPKGGRSA